MDHDTIEVVRNVGSAMREEGVTSFTACDLCARDERLTVVSPREVNQVLESIQQAGDCIYPEAMGTDGTHLWSFGCRPVPSTPRRPIGQR